jgi:hypothetical protein
MKEESMGLQMLLGPHKEVLKLAINNLSTMTMVVEAQEVLGQHIRLFCSRKAQQDFTHMNAHGGSLHV